MSINVFNFLSPAQPSSTNKPRSWRGLWLLLGITSVATISATAGALLAVSMTSTPLAQRHLTLQEAKMFNRKEISSGSLHLPSLTRPVNILVLGTKVLSSDVSNPPAGSQNLSYEPTINSLEGLSDTMLLLRFDPANQQLVALSIPRDTQAQVPGGGLTKINEANAIGGPASAAKAVSDLLGGIGIDRYVRINVQGVEKLLEALGGVTVYVPQDMRYQDDTQHLYIDLKQGEQHLSGAQALQFLRFRYDQFGDIGRVQRQQMLMRALMEQTLKPATVSKLPEILSIIQSHIDTNLSVEELIALVGFATKTDRAKVQMLLLPGDFSNSLEASYWLPNLSKITELVSRYFGAIAPDYADAGAALVKVAIQDSTNKPTAAQQLMQTLGAAGYGNVFIDNPWSQPLPKTRIIAQQGNQAAAEAVRKALGFGEVFTESTGNLESDVTVRLGQDAVSAPANQPSASPLPTASPQTSPSAPPKSDPLPSPAVDVN